MTRRSSRLMNPVASPAQIFAGNRARQPGFESGPPLEIPHKSLLS
jgi:hypothetical protein